MRASELKSFVLTICVAVFAPVVSNCQSKLTGKDLDIFLLIGQSNMAGVAEIGNAERDTLNDVYLFNDKGQWENAFCTNEGFNRYSTVRSKSLQKLGPAYSFASKLASYTGNKIGIVCNARGGTAIEWWQKGYEGEKDLICMRRPFRKLKRRWQQLQDLRSRE